MLRQRIPLSALPPLVLLVPRPEHLDKLGKTLRSNVLMPGPGDICDTFVSLVDGKLVDIMQWN